MTAVLAELASTLTAPPPWLMPYLSVARDVLHSARPASVAGALNCARGDSARSLSFVEQSALPEGEPYESFIARTATIPTRDNLHDLFNGLAWLSYPKTKRRLNVLQAQEIAARGVNSTRGSMRDALTLFDENAAILQAPAILIDALRRRDWQTLFVSQRAAWQAAHLTLFGHALLEKLMQPRKAITAHVWVVDDSSDAAVAASLTPQRLIAKDFLPLPVLGVPGWWPANEQPGFYDDVDVFRLPRQ